MRKLGWIGVAFLVGCSSSVDDGPSLGEGGSTAQGSGGAASGGSSTGGANVNGGASMSGGAPNGGTSNNGGSGNGGATSGGTSNKGGTSNNGGSGNGGATSGGASSNGGKANSSGGKASGGATTAGGATTTGGAGGGEHTNPLTQAQIDAFVNAHNQARSGNLNPTPSPALPPVTWDATLADVAYNYLSKCKGTSLADHNANRTADYKALGGSDYVGENIYASSGKAAEPAAAVSSWMSEASSFDYNNPNLSAAGHYTQVVWRASVRIGCAIVNCPALKYPNNILCDYAPGGNINGQKPY